MLPYHMKMLPVFSIAIALACTACGGAQRYTENEVAALQSDLSACARQYEQCRQDRTRLESDLGEAVQGGGQPRGGAEAGVADTQALLDRTLECMEQNQSLLKQLSRFKVITQERKDAQWRLTKANEHLAARLKSERMNDRLYVVKAEDTVKIIIPQRSLFPAPSSAWLMSDGAALLRKVAGVLKELKPLAVAVAGHTDGLPIPAPAQKTYPTQWDLGLSRAVSVLLALEHGGIGRDTLSALSHGDTRPIAAAGTDEGRAMNRRVEIVVTP